MNKKIIPLIMSGIMISQTGICSFADQLNNSSTENDRMKTYIGLESEKKDKDLRLRDLNNSNSSNNNANTANSSTQTNPVVDDAKKEEVVVPKLRSDSVEYFLQTANNIKRVYGYNRTATSIEISKFSFDKADTVIIADAYNYPDALSAASLTKSKYPVLLLQGRLSYDIINEISRLQAKNIIILGGETSISSGVESRLSKLDGIMSVHRIAGKNRYETNARVFSESKSNNIVVANGENFPDALASSSLLKNGSLVLVRRSSIPASTNSAISNRRIDNIDIIGGYGAVGRSVSNRLENYFNLSNFSRISGENRYSTSVNIAKRFNSDVAIVASGENFPDALAASSLSQKLNAPILLVSRNNVSNEVQRYLIDNNIKKVIILGGENTISSEAQETINFVLINRKVIKPKYETVSNRVVKPIVNKNDENNVSTETVDSSIKTSKGSYVVTKNEINIYSDEQESSILGKIPNKKIVKVLSEGGNMLKIDYNGKVGWIEANSVVEYNVNTFGKVVNYVPYISQLYPVYAPNGCEPTSMLMGLKGKGYTNIGLRPYLDAIPKTKTNPRYGYVGVPYNVEEGRFQTIDPKPLAQYGQRYGNVVNIQGASKEDIIREIQNGNTVVLWATLYWNRPYFKTLMVDGKPERRIWNNHVVLVTGYDPAKKMFYIADPYNHEKAGGNRRKPFYYWKSEDTVMRCYNYDNRRFAVAIR